MVKHESSNILISLLCQKMKSPAVALTDLVATLKLPQAQIPKFDGEPMKYWMFMRQRVHLMTVLVVPMLMLLLSLIDYCSTIKTTAVPY